MTFSPERLRVARALGGLTVSRLADESAVSRQYLHALESDAPRYTPSEDVIAAIADALDVSRRFLTTAPRDNQPSDFQFHFRSRKSTSQRLRRQVIAHVTCCGRSCHTSRGIWSFLLCGFPGRAPRSLSRLKKQR